MSKPQRRKGNAKTASSSAAANFLGDYTPSMIGFNPEMNIFDMSSTSLDTPSEIDVETRNVLRKFSKKDPHTREKGIRELLEKIPEIELKELELVFVHVAAVFDRLATDGSQTVRMLSLKLASLFISILKKAAQKSLKKVIPFVILSLSDVSNSVINQANVLLNENFPDEKKTQAVSVFSPIVIELAVQLISGKSDLCVPAKYDDEEEKEQRLDRLTVQSLATLTRLVTLAPQVVDQFSAVEEIYKDNGSLKKIFAGNKVNVKIGLLSVCTVLPNKIEVVTSSSPLLTNILASLDSKEDRLCQLSWDLFLSLAAEKIFYEKVNTQKTVIPKLHFVVRSKQDHWKIMGPMLLPAVALVSDQFETTEEKSKWLTSALESMTDNLPFAATAAVSAVSTWSSSYVEIIQWILSQHKDSNNRTVHVATSTSLLKLLTMSVHWNDDELTEKLVGLLKWILEKDAWDDKETSAFIITLKLNIMNDPTSFKELSESLLKCHLAKLVPIHVAALQMEQVPFYSLECLADSEDFYMNEILKTVNVLEIIQPTRLWKKNQAKIIAKLVARCFERGKADGFKIENDAVGRFLYTDHLSSCPPIDKEIVETMVRELIKEADGKLIGRIFAQQESMKPFITGILIKTVAELPFSFVVDFMKLSGKMDDQLDQQLSNHLFRLFFTVPRGSIPSDIFLSHTPSSECSKDFLYTKIQSMTSSDLEELDHLTAICNSLAGTSRDLVKPMSLNEAQWEAVLGSYDYLSSDVLYNTNILVSASTTSSTDTMHCMNLTHSLAFSYVWLSIEDSCDGIDGFGALIVAIFNLLQTRNRFHEEDHHVSVLLEAVVAKLNKKKAVDELLAEFQRRQSNLILCAINDIVDKSSPDVDLPLLASASMGLKSATDKISTSTVEKWAFKLNEETGEGLIEQLKSILDDGSANEVEETIFALSEDNEPSLHLNLTLLRAWNQMEKEEKCVLTLTDKTVTDFLLCGLVALFDAINDMRSTGVPESLLTETITSLILRIFSRVAHAASRLDSSVESLKEWNEFFAPTIHRIVFHWWAALKHDSPSTPYVRSLYWAVINLPALPEDLEGITTASTAKFLPSLDTFKYPEERQQLIIHAFEQLKCTNQLIQMMGLHVIKMFLPSMLLQENSTSMTGQSEEINLEQDSIRLPTLLTSTEEEVSKDGLKMSFLLDAAIIPLEEGGLEGDQRVMYCDALTPMIKSILPKVISAFPEAIAKSKERDYLLSPDPTPSPQFVDKYNAHLLFRVLSALPALIRTWYNSLPTQGASIVARIVKNNISKYLIEKELDKVLQGKKKNILGGNMKIRIVPTSGEVIAEYTVEETTMRLNISMPTDWPLSVPPIDLEKAIVKSERAQKWLRQLATYLFYQNGSMVEGIAMWQKNVDRDVEGVEECSICMMAIHATTHQLPKSKCKQCKHKFHTQCLYKWFDTSKQPSCPLCRSNFT